MVEETLCPYFKKCGGCSCQNIEYSIQLENKKKRVLDLISASGIAMPKESIQVFKSKPFNYRNRMDFIFHERGLGFRKKDKFSEIVDIKNCKISNNKINILLSEVRNWFLESKLSAFNLKKKRGVLKYAVIRAPENIDNSSISFVLNEDSRKTAECIEKIKEFSLSCSAKNIAITYVPANKDMSTSEEFFMIKGKEFLKEVIIDTQLSYSIQGFFQNNSLMAETMVTYCKKLFEQKINETLVDLYGGVGLFGISLNNLFKKIHILEFSSKSIEAAKENILFHNSSNVSAICGDAAKLNSLDIQESGENLAIITDPPRTGMEHKVIRTILELKPQLIVYISCNPLQLSKDLRYFSKDYFVESISVFDMFPQTNHVETMIVLKQNN